MEFVNQEVIFWGETPYTFEETLKWIEKAGRTCYDSLDRITDTSYNSFVYGRVKDAHLSIVEHSNLVLRTIRKTKSPISTYKKFKAAINSPNIRVHIENEYVYIAGNYRAFLEHLLIASTNNNDAMFSVCHDSIKSMFSDVIEKTLHFFSDIEPCAILTESKDVPNILKRVTFEYVTDRSVTHELVRHRRSSFSQRSQRYVKENNLQIIIPYWFDKVDSNVKHTVKQYFRDVEFLYRQLISKDGPSKLKAEEARGVLPNAIATTIVMTTSINNVRWLLKLRDSDAAYPPARALAVETKRILVDAKLLNIDLTSTH